MQIGTPEPRDPHELTVNPVDTEHPGYCPVCHQLDDCNHVRCETHGWTEITSQGRTPGFSAGDVYWADLACGCQLFDDDSYLES